MPSWITGALYCALCEVRRVITGSQSKEDHKVFRLECRHSVEFYG